MQTLLAGWKCLNMLVEQLHSFTGFSNCVREPTFQYYAKHAFLDTRVWSVLSSCTIMNDSMLFVPVKHDSQ